MIRSILLGCLAALLGAIGLVGLLVPVLPGFLFLLGAGACAAAASPQLRQRLERSPTWRRSRSRWAAARDLSPWQRARLAFWLSADATLKSAPFRRAP